MKGLILRNGIFESSRKISNELPDNVLKAYDTLLAYVKDDGHLSERMCAQLQSESLQNMLSTGDNGWVSSNRKTAPTWLKKHCEEFETYPRILFNYLGYHWLDHQEYWRNKTTGDVILIGQPYRWLMRGMRLKEMQELINKCKNLGIGCQISATSTHYPGKTLLLIFYELKGEK